MKKSLVVFAAATALALGTLAAPQPAKADISALWLVPAVIGGMWIGGAIAAGPAYAGPYGYVGPYAYAGPYAGPYYASPVAARRCWAEQRSIRGRLRTVQVCY